MSIADEAARLRHQGIRVVDFSAGRAFEPSPGYVSKEAANALLAGDTHQTMARGTLQFRKACATKLARDNNLAADWETEIIATMGVKQALTLALLSVVNPGDEVLVEDPCFVSYFALINIAGGRARAVPLKSQNNFRWTREQLSAAVTPRTRAILLNSPQNPTGTVHTEKDLDIIAEVATENDLMVITDEVYERVTWEGHKHTCIASLTGMKERTLTCMGLTKTFSMGGWRIGFIFAVPEISTALEKLQQHLLTCASSFTQAGAAIAFSEPPRPEVTAMWHVWEERCEFMSRELNAIKGLSCNKPEGGFYAWVDIKDTGRDSNAFSKSLLTEKHVAVVPGSEFGPSGEGFIRITCVKSNQELKEGIKRITQFVHNLG